MQIADDTAHCTINTDVTDGADAPAHTHLSVQSSDMSIPLRSMPVHVRQSAHERADPQRQSPYDKPPILGKELHNGIILAPAHAAIHEGQYSAHAHRPASFAEPVSDQL